MDSLTQLIVRVTEGRRFCFVIMTYHERFSLFERIRATVVRETGFECIRADDVPASGYNLRDTIHACIEGAALVIADVSDLRPNIFYEVGYAVARGKPLILLAHEGCVIPTDLLGVEVVCYSDTKTGLPSLEESLVAQIKQHADSGGGLLRAMILPADPGPSYIVVSPWLMRDVRFRQETAGDYLGVRGILGAFASVFGEFFAPEILIASPDAPSDLFKADANFYLIGGPAANRFTPVFLQGMQSGRPPNWAFDPHLKGLLGSDQPRFFASEPPPGSEPREDCGLIVRGPHPWHPRRMATVMAGSYALGTAAACVAGTRSEHARRIGDALVTEVDLAARDRTIWVLVRGKCEPHPGSNSQGVSVEIVAAGVYPEDDRG